MGSVIKRIFLFCSFFFFIQILFAQTWQPLGPFETPSLQYPDDYFLKMASGTGRVSCLRFTGKKSDRVFLLGSPYGGLFKSLNQGLSWKVVPLLSLPIAGISDVAVHPCKKNTWFVVSGDPDCIIDKNSPALGCESCQSLGVFKTVDGGKTVSGQIGNWYDTLGFVNPNFWMYPSLKIARKLLINPKSPKMMHIVIHTYSGKTNTYDGFVYSTYDGGENWKPALSVKDGYLKDIEFQPGHPSTIYASGRTIYRSFDNGKTWASLQANGLLIDSLTDRCEIAVSQKMPDLLIAFIINKKKRTGELYRSLNGGDSFSFAGTATASPEWRTTLLIDNDDPGRIYLSAGNKVGVMVLKDSLFKNILTVSTIHDDLHDLTQDLNTGFIYASSDGGLYVSEDRGKTWLARNVGLNVAECWGLSVTQSGPLKILVGTQDCGTILYHADTTSSNQWVTVRGGDGMATAIDPNDPQTMFYNDGNNNIIGRTDDGGLKWSSNYAIRGQQANYRRPFALNPVNASTVFAGYKQLFRSENKGVNFTAISDLKLNSNDNIQAFAISKSDTNVIYLAYSNPCWSEQPKEKLFVTKNGGLTWNDITSGLAGVKWFSISSITIDPADANSVFVGFNGGANIKVMHSINGGTNWTDISAGLTRENDVNCLYYEQQSRTLFAGTHVSVLQWREDKNWENAGEGLPVVMVVDLDIRKESGELFAGTHGRGVWKLRIKQ